MIIKPLNDDELSKIHLPNYPQTLRDMKHNLECRSRLNVIKQITEQLEKINAINTSKPEFASAVQRYMVALQSELNTVENQISK